MKRTTQRKYKTIKKTIKGQEKAVCITLNLHNNNIVNNHHRLKNQQKLSCRKAKSPLPRPKPNKPRCSPSCHSCVPRRGELIINGGFENHPDPFCGWIINNGVSLIRPNYDFPHQGYNAVRLGAVKMDSGIYQDVPGICPGYYYQLNFFLKAAKKHSNATVFVMMAFLDQHKNPMHCPAMEIIVAQNSLTNESYSFFINATYEAAPLGTRFARISFWMERIGPGGREVLLDDVSLIAFQAT